jgi:hypothetical protein
VNGISRISEGRRLWAKFGVVEVSPRQATAEMQLVPQQSGKRLFADP